MPKSKLNQEIEAVLRNAYQSAQGKRHSIRLPTNLEFSRNAEAVRLVMPADTVTRNMQDDVAAFEGWLLALKAWGCIDHKAELEWAAPEDTDDGRYQRFLYRVTWFAELFPSWFRVDPKCQPLLEKSRITQAKTNKTALVVNTAKVLPNENPDKSLTEALLEKYLADSGWLASTFVLDKEKVGRQFPVGVFEESVQEGANIFPRGKSAIDLVGIDSRSNRIWVFELKATDNQSMGIVSELFFYVAVIHDLLRHRFTFKNGEPQRIKGRLHHTELEGRKEICGCLLAPEFHPLLDENHVIDLLNSASWPGDVKVIFSKEILPQAILKLPPVSHG